MKRRQIRTNSDAVIEFFHYRLPKMFFKNPDLFHDTFSFKDGYKNLSNLWSSYYNSSCNHLSDIKNLNIELSIETYEEFTIINFILPFNESFVNTYYLTFMINKNAKQGKCYILEKSNFKQLNITKLSVYTNEGPQVIGDGPDSDYGNFINFITEIIDNNFVSTNIYNKEIKTGIIFLQVSYLLIFVFGPINKIFPSLKENTTYTMFMHLLMVILWSGSFIGMILVSLGWARTNIYHNYLDKKLDLPNVMGLLRGFLMFISSLMALVGIHIMSDPHKEDIGHTIPLLLIIYGFTVFFLAGLYNKRQKVLNTYFNMCGWFFGLIFFPCMIPTLIFHFFRRKKLNL